MPIDLMKIYDKKIWRDGQKIGWIDGEHIRLDTDGRKLGYFENGFVYNEEGHKVAYIFENELRFENGQLAIPLERINEEIEGTASLLEKCAVQVLLEE
jgi:hypothetical protein